MRYIVTALVALMVVLAGCSTADTGGTPTAETNGTETAEMNATETSEMGSTPTPEETESSDTMTPTTPDDGDDSGGEDTSPETTTTGVDASEVPGVEGSQLTNSSALLSSYSQAIYSGHTEFETTFEGNPDATGLTAERISFQLRNDTEQQLYVENTSNRMNTYFVDGEQAGVRNDITGEIRYSNQSNFVGQEARLTGIYGAISISYIPTLEWEATGNRTVDGEEHYVLEPTGLSRMGLARAGLSPENVSSGSGRLVVGADGVVHTGQVTLEGNADISVTYALDTDESIEVTAPSWYDESQAS